MSRPVLRELFCYGTLEFPSVMQAVAGRCFPGMPAVLPGYRRAGVKGEVFPGIVAQPGSEVSGTVFSGLTSAQLRLLDAYENAFYRRRPLRVRDAAGRRRLAWTYVVPALYRHRLESSEWDPGVFLRRDYARYLRRLRG
ncbi:MAG: gamma-glutamylcyclotransferase [Gammaproteobacteria bacterium]|nr:gamma-glutamylcyclotransferase [Gammaproteobacteria bacterium]